MLRSVPMVSLLLFSVVSGGCPGGASDTGSDTDTDPGLPVPLADGARWVRLTDESVDVFADRRPADAICDEEGFHADPITKTVEVATELCDYLTLTQPSLVALEPGDSFTVHTYHDVLTAEGAAVGYMGLAIGGEIEWEVDVPIPNEPAILKEDVIVDRSIPAGTPLQFHVHNHGPNTWELVAVLAAQAG